MAAPCGSSAALGGPCAARMGARPAPRHAVGLGGAGLPAVRRTAPLVGRSVRVQAAQPSTSGNTAPDERQIAEMVEELRRTGLPQMALAAAVAPLAAASLNTEALKEKWTEAKKAFRQVKDTVYYGDVLPPVGSQRISYARFLQLVHAKRVKRVVILGDGKCALVECPAKGWASNYDTQRFDRKDLSIMYADQHPEWRMEKYRFYCELPGDMWEDGSVMRMIKENIPHVQADGRMPYSSLLREGQVTPELQVMDSGDSAVWLNQYVGQFLPIVGLLVLRVFVGFGSWVGKLLGKKPKKSKMEEMAEKFGAHRAKEFNVGGKGKTKADTGVRFADVAGIDHVKNDINDVLEMLLGKGNFKKVGAKTPRGILLEGPPGTGKTYLARAMAGEAGIPFYSANGAEFVEMFSGVAAMRIRSLFKAARKNAPAIVFIDEIDAIGKARSAGPTDPGTKEREQGLLQLLVEMDGFKTSDDVLVIGATNRIDVLDSALLRPGRFDRAIYMGRPSASNRLKILDVHAKDKAVPRGGSDRHADDALLRDTAEMTIGYSGAELANLLNESAILAVRKDAPEITSEIVLEAMDKIKLGLPQPSLPDTDAKRRFAAVEAGRATVFALTAGMPQVELISIQPRGGVMGRIVYVPMEFGKYGDQWHTAAAQGSNAVENPPVLGSFEFCAQLLAPLYAARATEEVLYGKTGVTLSTAKEVSRAGELAGWLVEQSGLHPDTRRTGVVWGMELGGWQDTTTQNKASRFEPLTLKLQRAAYARTLALVRAYQPVIEAVADELSAAENETVRGERLISLIRDHRDANPDVPANAAVVDFTYIEEDQAAAAGKTNGTKAAAATSDGVASYAKGAAGRPGSATFKGKGAQVTPLEAEELYKAAMIVSSDLGLSSLVDDALDTAKRAQETLAVEGKERMKAVSDYAGDPDAPFPPAPTEPLQRAKA